MGIIPQKYRSFDYTCKKCEDGEIRSLIRTSLSYAHHSLLGADQTKFFLCGLEDHSVGSCGGNWLGPAFGLASSRPKKECVEYVVRDVGYSYRFRVFTE